jgi:hypothetical protein
MAGDTRLSDDLTLAVRRFTTEARGVASQIEIRTLPSFDWSYTISTTVRDDKPVLCSDLHRGRVPSKCCVSATLGRYFRASTEP